MSQSPKFGDQVENGWASEENPTRKGIFVRAFNRRGRLNAGLTWEITDGNGKFWELQPRVIGERLTVTSRAAALQPDSGPTDVREPQATLITSVETRAEPPSSFSEGLAIMNPSLKELAEAATPGPWSPRIGQMYGDDVWVASDAERPWQAHAAFKVWVRQTDDRLNWNDSLTSPERKQAEANAAYIAAASPDVILDLITRLEASEARAARAEEAWDLAEQIAPLQAEIDDALDGERRGLERALSKVLFRLKQLRRARHALSEKA